MWSTCEKFRPGISLAICVAILTVRAQGQNRGVYPLGMSATNSGVTPGPGFTYVNQLLFYSRDHAKDDVGSTLPVTGENYVLMDMNTLAWVRELVTMIHLAKYTGAPASRAEELVMQIATSIEGLSEVAAWRDPNCSVDAIPSEVS